MMSKRAGRPPAKRHAAGSIPKQLLQAAGECLRDRPTSAISIREVADRAGVNSAMVAYYFGSKAGLFTALLDSAAAPLLTLDIGILKALPAEHRIQVVVGRFAAIHQATPWLPRLIIDEVIAEEGELRERLVAQVGTRIARLLKRFIRLQQQDGYFRGDLDVRQASIMLLGMLVFPVIASPLLQNTHGLKPKQLGSEKWIGQLCRMIESGCKA